MFLADPGAQAERERLAAMNNQILHRGPDDGGLFVEGRVGLAMRRLSIVDLKTGHQPLSNEDENIWIVFNGEIYNHQQLRAQLETAGHRYRTRSDTETIVHAYEEFGRDCVDHLRGMFAFAIWDRPRRKLFIARDRLGIKPLYYRFSNGLFLFGSEIKTILAYPGVEPEFDQAGLAEYLAFGYRTGEDSFYAGIKKLLPAHTLELDEHGNLSIQPYWDLSAAAETENKPRSHYVQGYRELLEQCVDSHLMSDVPLGVFLSGGLDSSVIAALTARSRQEPIQTFAVGYGEEAYSELPFARQVAQHIGSEHHEIRLSRQEFFDYLPKLVWHEDEPIVWPSSISLYAVARLARERVTVVLTGEGSDETLAGYTRYAWTVKNAGLDKLYRSLTPDVFRRAVRRLIHGSGLPASLRRKLEHTFLVRDGASWPSFYFDNFYSAFSGQEQEELLTPAARALSQNAYAGSMQYWGHSSGDLLHRLLYTDVKTYLVELLMKQDQMSMAASIESRVPFLDHVLVEYTASIPAKYAIQGLSGKQVLKQAVEDLLPHGIIYRKKMGFPTPWAYWLAGPQLNDLEKMLLSPRTLERGFFQPEAVKKMFREHRAKRRDHGNRIWRLLNLETWFRVCIDRDTAIVPRSKQTAAVTS
jgi:asparagine synthase (glutamine-hydrolysing)